MKIIIFISIILLIDCKISYSQNYVSNFSFEESDSCPPGISFIQYANGWFNYNETPDYFHICASNGAGVPDNFAGYQQPFDGNAYAGIIVSSELASDYRECIGMQLLRPLTIGRKYFVSAYFSRGSAFFNQGASNNIGFKFFNRPYSYFDPCPIDNYADIRDTSIILDSINWTKVSGTFVADSNYTFFGIANFYDDLHSDTLNVVDSLWFVYSNAYYYVDYVCITDDSLAQCNIPIVPSTNIGLKDINIDNIKINLNNSEITVSSRLGNITSYLEIYDLFGNKIYYKKVLINEGENSLIVPCINPGLYIAALSNNGNRLCIKFIID